VTMDEDSNGKMNVIDASSSAKVAIDALEKLAQYVEPKLKAVEISGDPDKPVNGKWTVEFVNATPKD